MENIINEITKIDLFKDIDIKDLKEMTNYFKTAKISKKETIFDEGDASNELFIVLKGKIKITKLSKDGKEIILEIAAQNEIFGGVAVINNFPYPANAIAMEESEILKISRKALIKLIDIYPQLMLNLTKNFSARIKNSYEALKNMALEKVEARIATLLLKLAEKSGEAVEKGTKINIKLTKLDIAEMVGTTVETAIRTMSKFKKNKFFTETKGFIVITNKDALIDISA
ncbi:MAG: Crp/Fnr family transcriptional regulator [Nitrospirae bacterium]|nr:Crp/Fnr family transcriptional regulator [Nitrospirota bacterium]MBF0541577.1 Crp/Fnr family transcriptional regulator [Nitrospirota bacterium]